MYASNSSNRLSWLTPWDDGTGPVGPWLLTQLMIPSPPIGSESDPRLQVSETTLLNLLGSIVDRYDDTPDAELADSVTWVSSCGRYRVRWQRNRFDETSLFVQQRSDHLAMMELCIDNEAVATFHEPVWPHLQPARANASQRISLPRDCVQVLEQALAETGSKALDRQNASSADIDEHESISHCA